jgi:hypothetical protein
MAKSKRKGGVKSALKRRAAYRKGGRGGPDPARFEPAKKETRQAVRTVGRKDPPKKLPAAELQVDAPRPPEDIKSRGTVGSSRNDLFGNLRASLDNFNIPKEQTGYRGRGRYMPPPQEIKGGAKQVTQRAAGPRRPVSQNINDLAKQIKASPEEQRKLLESGPAVKKAQEANAAIQKAMSENPKAQKLQKEMSKLAENPRENSSRLREIQADLSGIQQQTVQTVAPNYSQLMSAASAEQTASAQSAQPAMMMASAQSAAADDGPEVGLPVEPVESDIEFQELPKQDDSGFYRPTQAEAPEIEVAKTGTATDYDAMAKQIENSKGFQDFGIKVSYDPETGRFVQDNSAFGFEGDQRYKYFTPEEFAEKYDMDPSQFQMTDPSLQTQEGDIQQITGPDDVTAPDAVTPDTVTAETGDVTKAQMPGEYNLDFIRLKALEKLPEGTAVKVQSDGSIAISAPGGKRATYSPEEAIKLFDLEGDFGTSLKAETMTAAEAADLDPTEAAQMGELSEQALASVTEKTALTKEAEAAQIDEADIKAAYGEAATRPEEVKAYVEAVTDSDEYKVLTETDPTEAQRTLTTISDRQKQDLLNTVSKEGTNLEDIPEFALASTRTAQVGTAATEIAQQLGTAPSVDFEGREAITGEAPKGDASQIGGIPTMAAASMQAVTGEARKAAAEDMMAVVANMPKEVTAAIAEDPASVEAQLDTDPDPTVTAAVAALPQEALVSTQMENLLAGMEEGKTPAWARPAVAAIEQQMAQRGLSASTVGRDALFNAIIQSALPIAQSNAQALQQRAQQNLSNEQQANLASAQNIMQTRMANLSNRQTAASQTAQMAQQIKVQQGQFRQEATVLTAQQRQQTELANFQAAQQQASQESSQRQQTALANLDAGSRIDLANLQALNAAGTQNLSAEQQGRLQSYQAEVNRTMRKAELEQDMAKANLSAELQLEMANLTEQNAAARDTMTAENQERLTNLQTLVDFKKTNASLAQQMDLANLNNEQQMELANLAERAATDSANMTEANKFKLQRLMTYTNIMSQNTELRQRAELAQLSAAEKVDLANLTATNQADSENMTAANTVKLAAYDKKMQAATVNAQLAQQMGLANLSNEQQAAMFNAQIDANLDMKQFDADQQMALANSQFMQTMTMKNLDNQQQAAIQNATAMANLDLASVDQQTKLAINNANAFLQRDMANLANEQQALVLDQQMKQQRILSNQSAENAARQFNATSENQTNQFMASMEANMSQFNASQANAMEQFNVAETNRTAAINAGNQLEADRFNAQITTQVEQFNAQMDYQVEQWNAANAQAVEQSNVDWRRRANLADTAAQNAANQQQAAFQFDLDKTAQTQLWQQLRDQAAFDFQREESERDRLVNVINAALSNESFMTDKNMASQRSSLFALLQRVTGGEAVDFMTGSSGIGRQGSGGGGGGGGDYSKG